MQVCLRYTPSTVCAVQQHFAITSTTYPNCGFLNYLLNSAALPTSEQRLVSVFFENLEMHIYLMEISSIRDLSGQLLLPWRFEDGNISAQQHGQKHHGLTKFSSLSTNNIRKLSN